MPIVQLVLEIKFSFIQHLFYVISRKFGAIDFAQIVEYMDIFRCNVYQQGYIKLADLDKFKKIHLEMLNS